ncbi:two component transcriptional regulator, winged helix family [Stanieria cyanosphaera PCC 7437]|uniref:Two component transcriptional regulator, winged helix family n=1 Tax=Stanieria cyanosphaera (strain ATCC 29371 / PCC 7437) TaxID=111780 RepID=K9XS39_STAC7|nr:response regulator transcription factor [Stanieria cyanosphaera]AFZ34487.1 two component transcriptional regulator, winged helix family [Stanieria cyanosphaera PCC 7437]
MYLLKEESCPAMEVNKKKILVVDDDPALVKLICRFFNYNNYLTEYAEDGKQARQIFRKFKPDLVILDINLPDETGLNLCQEIRKTDAIIIMLSSMQDTNYILEAFERGADDYIIKPFNLQILKAKIEALLRRYKPLSTNNTNRKPLVLDQLIIDFCRREVILDGTSVTLTALEFDLLHFLATNPNRVWDRAELIVAIWNRDDYTGDDRKVDIHIGRIRKKIGDLDGRLIKTIWGRGYMFELANGDKVKLAD